MPLSAEGVFFITRSTEDSISNTDLLLKQARGGHRKIRQASKNVWCGKGEGDVLVARG